MGFFHSILLATPYIFCATCAIGAGWLGGFVMGYEEARKRFQPMQDRPRVGGVMPKPH